MALKDWKKTYSTEDAEFYNNPITKRYIHINKKRARDFGNKKYVRWEVSFENDKSGFMIIDRTPAYFKSKSQALKFAKSYMRTH